MDLFQIILIAVSVVTIILTIVLFVVSKKNTNSKIIASQKELESKIYDDLNSKIQSEVNSKITPIQNNLNSKAEKSDIKSEVIAVLTDKENPIEDPQFVNVTLHNGRIYWDGLSYNVDKEGKKSLANMIDSKNMPYITLSGHDEMSGNDQKQCEKGGCFYVVRKDGGYTHLMNGLGNYSQFLVADTHPAYHKTKNGEFLYTASGDTAAISNADAEGGGDSSSIMDKVKVVATGAISSALQK